jgi:DNA-binding MarR family transcriptional regulator
MLRQLLSEQEPVGLLIGAARRRIKQAVGHRLRGYGLTPQQFWVLVHVREREGLALHELAERLRLDQPTTSRIVALLRRRKLVRMGGHPGDRRRCSLRLTETGAALGAQLHPLVREVREAVVHGMSAAEQDRLRRMLRQVMANMERFESAATVLHDEESLP